MLKMHPDCTKVLSAKKICNKDEPNASPIRAHSVSPLTLGTPKKIPKS